MAGALGVKRRVFFMLDGTAVMISVPIWVYLGFLFGSNLDEAVQRAEHIQKYIFGGLGVLIILYVGFRLWRRRRREKMRKVVLQPIELPKI